MVDFSALKNQRTSALDKLNKFIQSTETKSFEDNRYWTLSVDKAGNGMATIRFLPAPAVDGDEGVPFVRYYQHAFKGPGGWLIDNCPTTLGNGTPCPVCESNSVLWNTEIKANQEIVRTRKRKLYFVSNILVVSDPANPENNGKVFLFRYGKKIYDMINGAMNPQFADEKPLNPFDMWDGANFKLKARMSDGQRTYDKSSFDSTKTAISDDDSKLEAIWKSEYSLKEVIGKDQFKSYEDLKTRLNRVLGGAAPGQKSPDSFEEDVSDFESTLKTESSKEPPFKTDEDEDDLNYFRELAQ